MAGTLTVQNLQGPSSGANANKILIPSGQTLDVSGGTLTPSAGQVVQCVQYYNPNCSAEASSSTSLVGSSIRKTITPNYGNSLIIFQCAISMVDTAAANWLKAQMFLNDSAISGTGQYNLGYQALNHARYTPWSMQGQYTCTDTTSLEFRVYYQGDGAGDGRITHVNSSASLTLWEIAQ